MSWTVPEQAVISIEIWEDHAVVFSSMSGQTHLLNGLACEVLQLIKTAPETVATLVNKLCMIFDVEDKVDLEIQIQSLMYEFENLGLIESTQCEN